MFVRAIHRSTGCLGMRLAVRMSGGCSQSIHEVRVRTDAMNSTARKGSWHLYQGQQGHYYGSFLNQGKTRNKFGVRILHMYCTVTKERPYMLTEQGGGDSFESFRFQPRKSTHPRLRT